MAFVVTAGQIKAIQSASPVTGWGWTSPGSISLTPNLSLTYREIWRAQPQLRTVVGFLARNVAQLGIDVFQRASGTDRIKLPDHPVARLLERPFPETNLTKYRLLNQVMHDLCIYDDAFLLKFKLDSGPALLPISPVNIEPIGSTWMGAQQYRVQGATGYRILDANQVVHLHGYNPSDMRQGTSPIETLRQILAEEYSATQYREQLWRNGARVAGYLQRPGNAPRWGEGARDRFKADWQAQYAGDGPQSGGTPVLEDGMQFVPSGVTPKDAQYVESRKLTREEVAVAYYLSPAMVGMTEHTNFSSMRELHTMLYQDTLAPYLKQISEDFENQLLEDIDADARDGSKYIEFNLNEKMRGSFEEQTRAVQSAVGGPWMTRNEARSLNNMSEIDGGDDLIVPLNVVNGGLASPNDTAPDNPSDQGNPKAHPDDMGEFYHRQEHVVLSRVGAGDGAAAFDQPRWDRQLAGYLKAAGATSKQAADWAAMVNARTAAALAPGLSSDDAPDHVRRVFTELRSAL
jgi:HK97 family phage portal protein